MRTLLLIALLTLSFGLTALSLLAVRFTVRRQIQRDLQSDLQHSVATFLNLERQRREILARETALLADLPSLKALMTTHDSRTIEDAARDFWQVGGSDLFQLYDRAGRLTVSYGPGQSPTGALLEVDSPQAIRIPVANLQETRTLAFADRLYEVAAHPISFGSRTQGTLLGYVVLGSAIDEKVAREVSQATAADVAFTIEGRIAVSTLPSPQRAILDRTQALESLAIGPVQTISLHRERYLVAIQPLSPTNSPGLGRVQLVVLRAYADATHFAMVINTWLLALGALALLFAALLALSISRRVTRPLETLVEGARALGQGDFRHQLPTGGTAEIRELAQAFDHMRLELQSSQSALVDSERLATIGRMASSISHDLRHYISAMYANAEFLSLASTPQSEREQLIFEVETAVQGMTDLLDSLLGFSRTGRVLMPSFESIPYLIERAVALLRAHPEARSLDVHLEDLPNAEAWVDATKIVRAVFNLLLNACQAANRGTAKPSVTLHLHEDAARIVLRIVDNGPGVPASLVSTMFDPFVSRGKENGTGLGLTLAQHIATEHGGRVRLEQSAPGRTVFSLTLEKSALRRLQQAPINQPEPTLSGQAPALNPTALPNLHNATDAASGASANAANARSTV